MQDTGGAAPGGDGWGTDAQVQGILDGYGMVVSGPLGSGVAEAFASILTAVRAREGLSVDVVGSVSGGGAAPPHGAGAAQTPNVLAVPDCERLEDDAAEQLAASVRSGELKVLIGCHYAHHRSVSTSHLCQLLPFARAETLALTLSDAMGMVERAAGAAPSAVASGALAHLAGARRGLHGAVVRDALDAGLLTVRGGAAVLLGNPEPGPALLRLVQDWKTSLTTAEETAFDVVCLARRVWVPDLVPLTGDDAVDGLLARGLLARAGLGVHRVEPVTRIVGTAARQLVGMARRRELAAAARSAGLILDPVSETLWMAGTSSPPASGALVAAATEAMGSGRAADALELLASVADPRPPAVRVLDAAARAMRGEPLLAVPGAQPGESHGGPSPAGDSARTYLRVQHLLRSGDYPAALSEVERARRERVETWAWHRGELEARAAAGATTAARALASDRAARDGGGADGIDEVFLAIMAGELDVAVEGMLRPSAPDAQSGGRRAATAVGLAAVLILTGSHTAGLRLLRTELPQAEAWDATGTGYAAHALAAYAWALEGRAVQANALLVRAAAHRAGAGPLGSAWLGTSVASLARLRLAGRESQSGCLRQERGAAREAGDRTRALLLGARSLAGGVDGAASGVLEDAGRVEGRFAGVSVDIAAGTVRGEGQRLVDAAEVLLDMGQYALVRGAARTIRLHGGHSRVPGRLIGEADRRARMLAERVEAAMGTEVRAAESGVPPRDAATPREPRLTPRQRDIAALAGLGMDNTQIAGQLGLAVRTVESHLHSIYAKGGAPRRRTGRARND